jgi:hypothetical protein
VGKCGGSARLAVLPYLEPVFWYINTVKQDPTTEGRAMHIMVNDTSEVMKITNAVSALKDMVWDIKNGYIDPVRLAADVGRYALEAFTDELFKGSFELYLDLED